MAPRGAARQPEPEPGGAPATSSRTPVWRSVAAVVVGVVLLVLVIRYAGVDEIHERMGELGWRAPLVLVPWIFIALCDAMGWRATLPPKAAKRVPFRSLTLVRMAGEAVNSMTPTAAVGGEPVKAHLLRAWGVSGSDSLASIVIAKTALTVSQSLFVVLGMAALFDRLDRGAVGVWLVALLLLMTSGFTIGLMWLQRRGPVTSVWRWARRIAPRSAAVARFESSARAIDARLKDYYHVEQTAFWTASVWHLAGWLLGVVEVAFVMWLIGAPVPWLDALIIEALSQPIRAIAVIIPGGLGTQEVGGVALCRFLGMGDAEAATLWLLKRGRELVFDGIGLVYLARRSALGRRGTA